MRPESVKRLRDKIRTLGYFEKRMHYFYRKSRLMAHLLAMKWQSLNHELIMERMIQFEKKAEWYRRHDVLSDGANPIPIDISFELELTKWKYHMAVLNYGKTARDIFEKIFNVTIPNDWK